MEKFFGELATLGFIGTISFVLTTDFGDSLSVLGGLSFTYTGIDLDAIFRIFSHPCALQAFAKVPSQAA